MTKSRSDTTIIVGLALVVLILAGSVFIPSTMGAAIAASSKSNNNGLQTNIHSQAQDHANNNNGKNHRAGNLHPFPSAHNGGPSLTVNALTANNETLHMWVRIQSHGLPVQQGPTPLTIKGVAGAIYQITLFNDDRGRRGSTIFNHWLNEDVNSTVIDRSNPRTITLTQDSVLTGVFNRGDRVSLQDLGVMQLVSHDLYNVERATDPFFPSSHPKNDDDERLNLSTLFNFGEDQIAVGGEPRNSENIALHTVAVGLGQFYLDLVNNQHVSPEEAKQLTQDKYMLMVKIAYKNVFNEDYPVNDTIPNPHDAQPAVGNKSPSTDSLTADLALRTVHSFLPGQIIVNGKLTPILDPSLRGKTLSHHDMMQLSKPLDGTFDPAFLHIEIFLPPPHPAPNAFVINLLERDSSFAKEFDTRFLPPVDNTPVSFEQMLAELKDGHYDKTDNLVLEPIRDDARAAHSPLDAPDG
jgi:hypothetical protein